MSRTDLAAKRCTGGARVPLAWARAMGTALLLAAGGWPWLPQWAQAAQGSHLPQRNLLVSWRVQSQGEASRDGAGLQRGAVVVGTEGGLLGRGVITYGSAQAEASAQGEMQVLVLNGAQARLSLGQQRPYTQWQLTYGLAPTPGAASSSATPSVQAPAFNVQAYSSSTWVDTGQGLRVRPSWPGGQALLTLEVETRSDVPDPSRALLSGGGEQPPSQLQAQTTLQVPLDRWVAVARTGGQQSQRQRGSDIAHAPRGTYSTSEVGQSGHTVLEIKVSLP